MTTLREAAQQALKALCRCTPEQRTASDDLRAALAQQEQEPVAWMMINRHHPSLARSLHWTPQTDWHITWDAVPLYTHPPRREWQGLKEWEINDGRDQLPTEDLCNWSFRKGVYFAEAKLKEKNHE